uniref:Interleukin 1 receptor associated kinase 1 binding protein 1 n=1 Tax=Pseudonaja textilis TaxID=8673 RepID=A0A670YFY0_PSETE
MLQDWIYCIGIPASCISCIFSDNTLVCIIFTDFGKMQDTCNHLVEKLDKSVIISSPHFYHTMEAVDTLRRQVCVSAVRSAQQKAQEVCQLFGHSVGKPLLIKEEEVKESEGHLEDHTDNSSGLFSFQQKLQSATIHISSRVFAIFEIKGEKRKKRIPWNILAFRNDYLLLNMIDDLFHIKI